MGALTDAAAIVGVGETEYSKNSGRTELALACEAISKAANDAGVAIGEIDGLVRYDMDHVDEVALTSHLGLKNLSWMSQTGYGGTGGNAVIVHAAAAIAAGVANTVVCYRALNERSGARYGQAATWDAGRGRRFRCVPDAVGHAHAGPYVRPVRPPSYDRVRHHESPVRRGRGRTASPRVDEPARHDA